MAQTTLQTFLQELYENRNLLKEREASYANAAPVYLLNQIRDYEKAIQLTIQALKEGLSLDDLQAEFNTFNLELRDQVVFVSLEPPRRPFTGQNPYRGLEKFTENEAEFFFGRTTAIQQLLGMVQRLVEAETGPEAPDLIAVLGASGSGKSSLVRAGLIPALRRGEVKGSERWPLLMLRPGPNPLDALAQQLAGLTGRGLASLLEDLHSGPRFLHLLIGEALTNQPDDVRLVLIIDQFEELFTLTGDETERRAFIDLLLYAAQHRDSRGFILLTMRADFYDKAAGYANLAEIITRHQMLVGPLTEKELREAILLPAEAVGLELEKDLAQALVQDTLDAPGALPLLQHALLELFHRRDGNLLTMAAYQEIGGVKGALAHRADSVLAGLTPEQQGVARNIFLRLTALGEGVSDTRRRVKRIELYPAGLAVAQVEAVLQALTGEKARLVVANEDTVEVTHEALIQQWATLRAWLEENREALRTQRRLTEAAAEWAANGQDSSYLYTGARLAEAEEWAHSHATDWTGMEQAFLTASVTERDREVKERRKRTQQIIAGLAVGLVLIAIAAVFGFYGQSQAVQSAQTAEARRLEAETARGTAIANQNLAATREAEAKQQASEARRALSRQLAIQAQEVLETYPQRSLLLAIEALSVTARVGDPRVPAAEEALRQVLANSGGRVLGGHEGPVSAVAVSSNNRWLVTTSGATARLWDLTSIDPAAAPRVLTGHQNDITVAVISPDSHWLATGSADEPARLWDLTTNDPGAAPRLLEGTSSPIAISPDSRWLVTSSVDKTARLWNLAAGDPSATPYVLRGHEDNITTVDFSPDGHWLVTASGRKGALSFSEDNTPARLWDLTAADPAATPIVLTGHRRGVTAVAFSPDNHWLVTASGSSNTHTGDFDGTARLWDLTAADPAATPIVLTGHTGPITAVAFSPDSYWLVTGGGGESLGLSPVDPSARVWNLTAADPAATPIVLTGHQNSITVIGFSSDSHWLITGEEFSDPSISESSDGAVRLWDLTADQPTAQPVPGHAPTISPDHRLLMTISDMNAYLWDLTAYAPVATPRVLRGHERTINAVAFSADTHWLVTGSDDQTARLWNLTTEAPIANPLVLRAEGDRDTGVISADSHWLVTGIFEKTARLWDLTAIDPAANPRVLHGHDGEIFDIAISPDSHWLVTGSSDKTARLWDLTAIDPAANPRILRGHDSVVSRVAISPDGHWLVTASFDSTARLWNLTNPSDNPRVLRGHTDALYAAAISPNSRWLVTSSGDKTSRLWDLTLPDPGMNTPILTGYERAISPDSRWLVTDSQEGSGYLWDLTAKDPAARPILLPNPGGSTPTFAFSSDSYWLVTGNDDKIARLWDLTASEVPTTSHVLLGHKGPIEALAFSPDNHWLVTAGGFDPATSTWDTTARLWDLTASDPAAQPVVLRSQERGIAAVAFSPDEQLLVTGSPDGTTRLWDLTHPAAAPIVLRGHEDSVDALAFSPDSRWLVTGSRDKTARLWDLQLDELISLACRTAGRNLTQTEWELYLGGEPHQTCPDLPLGIEDGN